MAVCTLSAVLAVYSPIAILADETAPAENFDTTENTDDTDATPEVPDQEIVTDPEIPEENPEQTTPEVPDQGQTDENNPTEEKKEALPITAGITVSGEAGDLTLVLTVTNGKWINENITDFNAVFAEIPAGITVGVAGQTDNTVTFHIAGNAAAYTKTDLVMKIPGNWLKDTADGTVAAEIPVEGHDLYWCAHADFGIRLKSKAATMDNAAFIAQQNLTENSADYDKVHFVYKKTEAKWFADQTNILEYPADDARIVGTAKKEQTVYEIVDIQGGWVYVESGNVRGFIKKEQVIPSKKNTKYRRPDTAKELIPAPDNKAYAFVRITSHNPLVKKDPRIALKEIEIKEEKNDASRTVGMLKENGVAYLLSYEADGWIYVESGSVRGFAKQEDFLTVKETEKKVGESGLDGMPVAEQTVEPADNKALYYKMISVEEGNAEGICREMIVSFAKTYMGNPYVYGGTDPVHGIDCSAFMQFLFGTYGISLPRTSSSQGFVGKMIPLTSLDQGDMIIYADDAEIYHVVMYEGDGKTVEAANESEGITSKVVNQTNAVWGISLLDDVKSVTIPPVIGKPDYPYETQKDYEKRLEEEKTNNQ
ncbi:MAG: C40 family peptidase [Lachnospiraceae bacterium]|nr:C40 family peptidase [Lachnospiraceae bacterium]